MNKISDFDFAGMYICKCRTKMCENYLHADIKVEIKKQKSYYIILKVLHGMKCFLDPRFAFYLKLLISLTHKNSISYPDKECVVQL